MLQCAGHTEPTQSKLFYFATLPPAYLSKLTLPSDFNGAYHLGLHFQKLPRDSNDPFFNR